MATCDLLVKSGWVVDPKNGINGRYDVAVSGSSVLAVQPSPGDYVGKVTIDAAGRLVMPGIVDSHVHIPGTGIAHREMALAGVTTAVDYGRFRKMMDELPGAGAGLCVAGLQMVGPYVDRDPSYGELEALTSQIVEEGALGVKIMGGHSPSTPGATAKIIETANRLKVYVGYHVGTTKSSSNLLGFREMFDLAGNNRLHVAHVNAYVRGMIEPATDECMEALERLARARWMVSESHLGPRNSTGGEIGPDGLPKDWVTRNCLKMGNYPLSREGMKQAFLDGYVAVNVLRKGRLETVFGEEGLRIWEDAETRQGVTFPVNTRTTAMMCATAKVKRPDGHYEFVVDAISTDGGSWRNFIVQNGLALWKFGALTIEEFVAKTSTVPAAMYGMERKGHLSIGADADITVIDHERLNAYATIVGGQVVMLDGVVMGSDATIICLEQGQRHLAEMGFRTQVVDLTKSLYWTKGQDAGVGNRVETEDAGNGEILVV